MRVLSYFILLVTTQAILAQTRPSDHALSLDDVRALLDAGKYQDVVRQTTKILGLPADALPPPDRHEALLLKAEAHLHLHQNSAAADAFEAAVAVAPDDHARDLDRATILLIDRCKRSTFTPKSPGEASRPERIDILDLSSRKLAFEALFNDERTEIAPRIKQIAESTQLPPILAAADQLTQMRLLERAYSGSGTESDQMLDPLAKRAESLMKSEIKEIDKRVTAIDKAANKKKKMGSHYRKPGLAASDVKELQQHVQTCGQMVEAATSLAGSMPDAAADFDEIRLDAQELGTRAQAVLAADYSGNFDRP